MKQRIEKLSARPFPMKQNTPLPSIICLGLSHIMTRIMTHISQGRLVVMCVMHQNNLREMEIVTFGFVRRPKTKQKGKENVSI